MTKAVLKKWLEKKKLEVTQEIESQYNQTIEEYREKRDTELGLDKAVEEITKLLIQADNLVDKFRETVSSHDGLDLNDGWYGTMKYQLHDLLSASNVRVRLLKEFTDTSKDLMGYKSKKNELVREVEKNYNNVIANVDSMKNAKAAIQYLQELGFDLSALLEADQNPVTTALSVPIDTRFLFVKENKNA